VLWAIFDNKQAAVWGRGTDHLAQYIRGFVILFGGPVTRVYKKGVLGKSGPRTGPGTLPAAYAGHATPRVEQTRRSEQGVVTDAP
jgi:hypothetical protein